MHCIVHACIINYNSNSTCISDDEACIINYNSNSTYISLISDDEGSDISLSPPHYSPLSEEV